jgi:hypothetical protein
VLRPARVAQEGPSRPSGYPRPSRAAWRCSHGRAPFCRRARRRAELRSLSMMARLKELIEGGTIKTPRRERRGSREDTMLIGVLKPLACASAY